MLTCPKCGHNNELGRVFCHQCGQKLDLNQIQAPGKIRRPRSSWTVGRILGLGIRLVILGVLIWGIYLAFQVPAPPDQTTLNVDLVSFYRKRDAMENAIQRQRPSEITFTEAEVNAFLQSLKLEQPSGRGVVVTVTKLWLWLDAQGATAQVWGKISLGERWEKKLALRYKVRPRVAEGRLEFEPVEGQIGSLPVPRWVLRHTPFMERWFAQVFGQLEEEKRLLNASSAVETGQHVLRVKYQPRPAS